MSCGEFKIEGKHFRKSSWHQILEALEVSGAPRGDQESLKEVSKSSQIRIHQACRGILSSTGALTDIGLASAQLRPSFDPSNICRRRGPLKLMSKLISQPKKRRGLDARDLTRPATFGAANCRYYYNTIASRIPAARPEGSPFAAQGILIF